MAGDSVIYEELRAEGASVSGAETGGDFQVSGAVNADLSSEASSTEQTSSSTSVIELFGIRLEDLEDEATGQVVEALVSGGDAILSSAVDAESSSSSSSVDGISETSSSFDVVGVGGTKANTAIEANGSLSSDIDFDLSSTAESTHSDSAVVIGGEQLSGSDFEQINVGGNWVASSDIAGSFIGSAESAVGDADVTNKIDAILGSSTTELLVKGSSQVDNNADISLNYTSSSQSGDASATSDLLQLLGLEIDGASNGATNAEIGGSLELDAETKAAINELATSESGNAITASVIHDGGGISLGGATTDAGFDADASLEFNIEQTSRSNGSDASASSTVTESVAVEADSQLQSGGETSITADQNVIVEQNAHSINGASTTASNGGNQVGIELGTQEAGGQVQLVVNNFLGGEAEATSVLATASTEEIQNYLAGLEAESLSSGSGISSEADTSLAFSGNSVSTEDNATSRGAVNYVYGVDAESTAGNTINFDASASTTLQQLAATIAGDAQAISELGEQEALAITTLLSSGDTNLIGDALASLMGDASSVDGTAESLSQLSALLGLHSETIEIEGDAELLANLGLTSSNDASSLTGDAIASTNAGNVEGFSVDQLDADGEITLEGNIEADLNLLASSVDGTANSELTLDELSALNGVLNSDSDAALTLTSDMSVSVESSSFSDDSSASFNANQQSAASGVEAVEGSVSSGSSLNFDADSDFDLALDASSVDGDANLNVAAIDGENSVEISGLNDLDLISTSDQDTFFDVNSTINATASTQEGKATAAVAVDTVAADAGSISSQQDGIIDLNASNAINLITNTSGGDNEDEASLTLDSTVSAYRGNAGDSIEVSDSGEISLASNKVVDLISAAEAGQASITAELESIGASLDDTGIISLDGTGDISGSGLLQAELTSQSFSGSVDINANLKGRGIQGGEVQGGGLEGSITGNSEVDINLLGLTLSGDSSNISESTSVGLDDSILSTGYGTKGIRGESQQSVDTLSSTELGNATAIHASKSIGILADDATSTVVTSDSDVVAIAQDSSYVTAMTSQGQASSQSSSETVGISGAEVMLYGEGNLVVESNSSATALSSSNE